MTQKVNDQEAVYAVVRSDFSFFMRKVFATVSPSDEYLDNWHLHAIAWHLTQVMEGNIRRLIITMPPRHLKSIAASIALPAYMLGHNPNARILCMSYAQELSTEFSLNTRRVMESDWYKACFKGTTLSKQKNTQDLILTRDGGYRLATSIGGSLTGKGGDILIIDDPHKADEALSETKRKGTVDWYSQTASTRLNDPENGKVIVIQQRFHQEDLAGTLLEQEGWTHLNLPAISESDEDIPIGEDQYYHRKVGEVLHARRMSKETLEQKRIEMGSMAFSGQYQQRPAPAGGHIIRWEWFRTYEEPFIRDSSAMVYQSWDTAHTIETTSDYTVGMTWVYQNYRLYLLDILRIKEEYPSLRHIIPKYAARYRANMVIIEAVGAGRGLFQELYRSNRDLYTAYFPKDDKVARMLERAPFVEAGRVYLPARAPWLESFRNELMSFPNGKHDDQVDAFSQALYWLMLRRNLPPYSLYSAPE